MRVIRVKCYNPFTNEDVYKFFEWHEASGRLSEVTSESAYAAGICEVEGEAVRRARRFCRKSGLKVVSLDIWEA